MPIYEFQCRVCLRVTELIYKKPDDRQDVLIWCSACQDTNFHDKLISESNFHLKGRGWAKDSYSNPLKGDDLENVTGEDFRKKYREQLASPDHPRKVGDILKKVGRKEK